MKLTPKILRRGLVLVSLLALLVVPALAWAGPRSGASFGGRVGFRSSPSFGSRSFSSRGSYGMRSPGFFFFPSYGWGWGGYGFGGVGSLVVMAVIGYSVFAMVRAARRRSGQSWGSSTWDDGDDDRAAALGRAYVYRLQVALGRSARGVQDRLAKFAAEGDTNSEAGLAALLNQTALELMREQDSIRYAGADGKGPMSLTNAETAMNALALVERSRFQVERIRGADGGVRRSDVAAEEGKEALEYVVVTVVIATRSPMESFKAISDRAELPALLGQLGSVSARGLLGLEVIWTPADPNDSMTSTDLLATYPDLRSL